MARTPLAGASPADQIADLERRHNLLIGLSATNLDSGRTLINRPDDIFAMCSTFKAYAAARVLQMVGRGQLSLDDRRMVEPDAILPNSPITETYVGSEMTLAQLCQAALQRSDNAAANILLTTMDGPAGIASFARSIGDERTRLDRWEIELNSAIPGDPRDTSTPAALAVGFREILEGDALSPPQRVLLQDWMRANETSSMRAGLPAGWTTADKTGSGDYGSTNDAGIAYGPGGERLLLVIMTRSKSADSKADNNRAAIGELAALVVPALL